MTELYLDNAATSYPKPPEVVEAVRNATLTAGGNPGRSSHTAARNAAALVYEGREAVARLFHGKSENVIFTENATHALNLAIWGLIPPNSHVLLSDIEHNAVLRPVAALGRKGVSYDFYHTLGRWENDYASLLASLREKLRPDTSALIACHRSNVLPVELPLALLGEFARKNRLLFIVDASQSAGIAPIDMEALGISALCAPAHKGLLGIRGCGFLVLGKNVDPADVTPLLQGGSGSDSRNPFMPDHFPDRLEAGTLPVEAIAALQAGISYIERVGQKAIQQKEEALAAYLRERLRTVPTLRLYCPRRTQGSVALFNLQNQSSASVAKALDERGIAIREGLHCAPLAHRLIGTLTSGAIRASLGCFNTYGDIDAFVLALREIARR